MLLPRNFCLIVRMVPCFTRFPAESGVFERDPVRDTDAVTVSDDAVYELGEVARPGWAAAEEEVTETSRTRVSETVVATGVFFSYSSRVMRV